MSAEKVATQEEGFGAAFAEPTTDPAKEVKTDVTPAQPEAKATATDPGKTDVKTDEATSGTQKADATATAVDPSAGPAAKPEPVQEVNHWRGKANYFGGKLRQEEEARKAADAKAKQLETELAALKSGTAKPPETQVAKKEDPLKRIEDELPETASATREAIGQAVAELRSELGRSLNAEEIKAIVTEALAPTREAVESDAYAKHWGEIRGAHPDIDEWTKEGSEFFKWRDALPMYLQTGVNAVLESGTASDVVAVVSDFKKATGKAAVQDKGAGDDAGKVDAAAMAVKTKSGVALPPGEKDQSDFGAAFREPVTA